MRGSETMAPGENVLTFVVVGAIAAAIAATRGGFGLWVSEPA